MLTTVVTLAALAFQIPNQELSTFLRDRLGFSGSDLTKIERGEVVTRKLESESNREVALVGVVRFAMAQQQFVERFRDIESFMQSEELTQIGRFSNPPRPEDLEAVALRKDDLDAMRECLVGDCDVKISAGKIAELRAMDWAAPDHAERLEALARTWLIEYVRAYLEEGNTALVVYDDRDEAQPLHEGFHALLAQSPYLVEYVPEFHHYLDEYPRRELPSSEDILYWAVEDFGLKPLTTVTHATIYERPLGGALQTLIALKQIYANHYFHAALKLMLLVDADDANTQSFYLVYLDRSLFDSKIGGFKRTIVEGRLKDNLQSRLESIRQRLAKVG